MDTYALLEQAILHREQVVAVYAGLERVFCPHALGTKGPRRQVLVYQFAGGSQLAGKLRVGEPIVHVCTLVLSDGAGGPGGGPDYGE